MADWSSEWFAKQSGIKNAFDIESCMRYYQRGSKGFGGFWRFTVSTLFYSGKERLFGMPCPGVYFGLILTMNETFHPAPPSRHTLWITSIGKRGRTSYDQPGFLWMAVLVLPFCTQLISDIFSKADQCQQEYNSVSLGAFFAHCYGNGYL